jgi:CRP/FNR family transcriptional regulator
MLPSSDLLKRHFPMLAEPELLQAIAQVGELREVPEGTVLLQIGQYIRWMPLVLEGSIKIVREDEQGRELFLYYLEGGDTCALTMACCLGEEKSHVKAIADADCRLVMVPVRYMDEWMGAFRSWKHFVMRTYAARFDEMLRALDALAFQRMDERLVHYLRERAKVLKSPVIPSTHQAIAYDLNSSREAVSRLLKRLEQQGQIRLGRNKIELLDPEWRAGL